MLWHFCVRSVYKRVNELYQRILCIFAYLAFQIEDGGSISKTRHSDIYIWKPELSISNFFPYLVHLDESRT